MPKPDRIRRLIPIFEQGRMWLPMLLRKVDYEGIERELVSAFQDEEYRAFPVGLHDDMLDCMARIVDADLNALWPDIPEPEERYVARRQRSSGGSWMSA